MHFTVRIEKLASRMNEFSFLIKLVRNLQEWRVNDVFILRHVLTDHTLHSHENGLDSEDINEVSVGSSSYISHMQWCRRRHDGFTISLRIVWYGWHGRIQAHQTRLWFNLNSSFHHIIGYRVWSGERRKWQMGLYTWSYTCHLGVSPLA